MNQATQDEILRTLAMASGCDPMGCHSPSCTCRIQTSAMTTGYWVVRRAVQKEGPPLVTPYTSHEVTKLMQRVAEGAHVAAIAQEFGRSYSSVYVKIRKLQKQGLLQAPLALKERDTGLTEKQKKALDFIRAFWSQHGFAPSYDVIAQGLGMRSKGNVARLIATLEADGYITKKPRRARSVRPVDLQATA